MILSSVGLKKRKEELCGCLLLLFALLIGYLLFMYMDITNTVDNANVLISCIKNGKILDFYDISVERSQTNFAANYNFPIYLLFGIWQAPVLFFANRMKINYLSSPVCMLWSKTLLMVFVFASAIEIYKIVCMFKEKDRGFIAVYLFLSSTFVYFSVFISSQIDVIAVAVMLGGLYYYLKGQNRAFYVFFWLATPLKMYALFIALPLLACKEKNIIKLLSKWIFLFAPIIIERIVFRDSPAYNYQLYAQGRDATDQILGTYISLGRAISPFLLIYIGIIFYSYTSQRQDGAKAIYCCSIVWAAFVCFCNINTYWVYLASPFLLISMCISGCNMEIGGLIESLSGFAYTIEIACRGSMVFKDDSLATRLLLPRIIDLPGKEQIKYGTLFALFSQTDLPLYKTLLSTIYVAGIMLLLYISRPNETKRYFTGFVKPRWIGLLIRPMLLLIVASLILYVNMAKTNTIAYDTLSLNPKASEYDLVSTEDTIVSQRVMFSDDRELDELILKFANTHYQRSNAAVLKVEIINDEGLSVFECFIGCNTIRNNEELNIDLQGTKVRAGREYIVKLSGKSGVKYYNDETLRPYMVEDEEKQDNNLGVVCVNGALTDKTLAFKIR